MHNYLSPDTQFVATMAIIELKENKVDNKLNIFPKSRIDLLRSIECTTKNAVRARSYSQKYN